MHGKAERLAPGMHNSASTLWPAWPVLLGLWFLLPHSLPMLLGLGYASQPLLPIYSKQEVSRHAGLRAPLLPRCWLNGWISGCSGVRGRP